MTNKYLSNGESSDGVTDRRRDDVIDDLTVPSVVVVPADEDPSSAELNAPLVPASEGGEKDPNFSETVGNGLHANWVSSDSAKFKPFSSGDLCGRDLLSSPTSSRVAFGLGSLDIIMDNDNQSRERISPDK